MDFDVAFELLCLSVMCRTSRLVADFAGVDPDRSPVPSQADLRPEGPRTLHKRGKRC